MNLKSILIAFGLLSVLTTPAYAVRGLFVSKTTDCSDVKSPEGSTATGIVTYCLPGLGANQNQLMAWNGTAWVRAIAVVGAPATIDYLVGTASPDLSAEIVVGATPAGELGGTWASPTVDATHSGSTHAATQAAAEATAATALSNHEADTTAVHGIANTALLGDVTEVQVTSPLTVTSGTGPIPVVACPTCGVKGDTLFSATDYNFSTTDPSAVTTVGVKNPIYHMPILSKVTAGALVSNTYTARITFTNAAGETLPSLIAALTVETNKQLKIRSPFAEWYNAQPTPTPSGITGITVQYVRANNGAGTGQMIYTSAGTTLAWKAPGSATAGTPVNIGAGGNFTVADGVDTTKTVDVSVVAASLPGNTTVNPALTANPAALNATGWNAYLAYSGVGSERKQNVTAIAPDADWTSTSDVAGAALPTANTTGSTVVTPAAFANSVGMTSFYAPIITLGSGTQKATHFQPLLIDDGGANEEVVFVSSVSGSTFTAVFTKTHSAGYTVKSATKGIAEAVFAIDPIGGNPDGGGTILFGPGITTIKAPVPLRDNIVYLGRGGSKWMGATGLTVGQSQIRYAETDTSKAAFFAQGLISGDSTSGVIMKNFFVNSDTHVVRIGGGLGGTAGFTLEGVKFQGNSQQVAGRRASAIRAHYGATRTIIKESQLSGSPTVEITGSIIIGLAIKDSWIDLQTHTLADGAGLSITANSGGIGTGAATGAALYLNDVVFEGGIASIIDCIDCNRFYAHNISNSDWLGATSTPSMKFELTAGTANLIHISDSVMTTGVSTVANIKFVQAAGSVIERVVIEGTDFDGNSPFVDAGSSQGPFIFRNNKGVTLATTGNGSIQNPPTNGIVYCGNVKVGASTLDPACNIAPGLVIDSSGFVGIGTPTPNTTLHIVGNAKAKFVNNLGNLATFIIGAGVIGADNAPGFFTESNHPVGFGTNNVSRWRIDTSGHFLAEADNTYDIGASGATRARTGYFGTSLVAPTINASTALQVGGAAINFSHLAGIATPAQISQTVNAQTGITYTYLDGDRGKLVTHTNAAAIAGTLPNAAGAGFDSGWFMDVQNRGAGTLTITPTTSTIDGAASLALTTAQGARVFSDGTNYFTQRGIGAAAAGDLTEVQATSPITVTSGTGPIPVVACATCAVGPASATDNAVARFDTTTGKLIQNSGVLIDDSNNVTGVVNLSATSVSIGGAAATTCNGAAGCTEMGQGTAPTGAPNANYIREYAPTSVTAYSIVKLGAAATGFRLLTNSAGTMTESIVGSSGSGSVCLTTGCAMTAPTIAGGTHTAITSLGVRSTGTGAFDLKIANTENLTVSDKTLTIALNDANRTLTVAGAATVSGTNTGDQTITLTGDVTGSGTGSFATTIAADSVALGTDTTGDYVSGVTASQGLLKTGTEGATLGLIDCAENQILKNTGVGGTAWTCAADADTGGAPAFSAITTGTNTTATMTVGTGGSLTTSGSGTITANRFGPGRTTRTATAIDLTIIATTHRLVAVTDTSVPRTITLPDSATAGAGAEFSIVDESNGAMSNNITVARAGTDTFIGGDTSKVLDINAAAVTVYTNGSGTWFLK